MNRREYFDDLASRWDDFHDTDRVQPLLKEGLRRFAVDPGEQVVDLGCGTGVLLGCLLDHLGPNGKVHAVDFSPRMIEKAKAKYHDTRVDFLIAEACKLPIASACVDRVLCFSAWPHFPNPHAVIRELLRVLKPGGRLHVWHVDSREKINDIHKHADAAVHHDILEAADRLCDRMCREGLVIEEQCDDDDAYLVTALKEN